MALKLKRRKIPQLDENKIRIFHDFSSTSFIPLTEKQALTTKGCQGTTVIIVSSQIQ